MNKISRVAITEYLTAVRSKAFIIGIIMLPIFMFGGLLVAQFAKDKVDIKDRKFAVVDRSGKLIATLSEQAIKRNQNGIFSNGVDAEKKQIRPRFILETFVESDGKSDGVDLILSERIRKKELFAFLIIESDALDADGSKGPRISYHTETPTFTDLPNWIEQVINDEIRRHRFLEANVDQALVQKLTRHTQVKRLGLTGVSATGEVIKAKEENKVLTFALPAISMFLLFMLVMSSAPMLLNTVLEEKLQKISEVLISAVTPFQLMLGKLIGAVFVSLTLSVLYLGCGIFFLAKTGTLSMVPGTLFVWFLLFQLLALMIYGSIFSAIGAACSELRDAQNMMFPAMMLVMVPMFTWMPVLQSPSSTFSRIVSLFPPATPMLMMLRIAIPPGPPWWEIALAVILTTGFMLACVWASAKIFRIGILSQGQTPSMKKLLGWLISR
ncbi:MAG: ABC transporter permease [Verrucomicrobia bacterium]|nr:ABC transporter permease [Verrucomicrobiota bacterium]